MFFSILTVVLVILLAGAGTFAFLSSPSLMGYTEASMHTTETVDIEVDGENPWSTSYEVSTAAMPGETYWLNFTIKNLDPENSANVSLMIFNISNHDGNSPEPEIPGIDDISTQIVYDLIANGITIISADENKDLEDVKDIMYNLGIISPGATMTVNQSYHLRATAGNEYQGDYCTFDIGLYSEHQQADDLEVDTSNAHLTGNGEKLHRIILNNTGTQDITIVELIVSWTLCGEEEKIVNVEITGEDGEWSGNAPSGTLLDISDCTISPVKAKQIDFSFDSNMEGKEFTIEFFMGDGSSKPVTFAPA